MIRQGRISTYERALAAHVAREPELAELACEAIDVDTLRSDTTRRILEVASEFKAACKLAGLLAVASAIHEPIEMLESLEELTHLPDWFVSELPTFAAAIRELSRPVHVAPVGALALWKHQLATNKRTKTEMDPLWVAAVCEARALDEDRAGQTKAANASRRRAADIVAAAEIPEFKHVTAKAKDPWQSVLPPSVADGKGVRRKCDPFAGVAR